ncbi:MULTISPECIES: DUF397 domain-containing protein [Actinomadura]|uniref:DUF397 domain-containing protein n=2 Tax=Actinomadura madurae TaxID=1993 RepID=A0A1I5WKS5_9ACTN|nr:DUF397 domain-containing protein [Actinomadura madurae]MCP9951400.1 DUF397 domain-containing protein [Actinomadura madurae]MCP9968173.1 DUF397 domain-containing protein [Actinomadura madurae]MCQ0007853.1 DUF397 domain-containing protein [Actinomadura madurae]URM96917.1 DUF397 domain-containing protein [Actinomadura madurae]URN07604.1 DUF397 domain-containing protein [Actinomadura madurae]
MVYRSDLETALNWRKASASQDSNDCVEVAAQGPSVLVRDSRNRSAGVVTLAPAAWRTLLNAIQNGDLDGR